MSSSTGQITSNEKLTAEALKTPTLLSFFVLALAMIQGALALESAHPTRISWRKVLVMLTLEIIEIATVLASEIYTFKDLTESLRTNLSWLQLLPHLILTIGLLELVADVYHTARALRESRACWVPMSLLEDTVSLPHSLALMLNAALSLTLVGWRQTWWFNAEILQDNPRSQRIAREEIFLSRNYLVGAAAYGAGIMAFVTMPAVWACLKFFLSLLFPRQLERAFLYAKLRIPPQRTTRFAGDSETPSVRLQQQYRAMVNVQRLHERGDYISHEEVHSSLTKAPLHSVNTIIGEDGAALVQKGRMGFRDTKILTTKRKWTNATKDVLAVAKTCAELPLILFILIAFVRIRFDMDTSLHNTMAELVDAVTVIAFQQIAVGIKAFMWKLSGASVENETKPAGNGVLAVWPFRKGRGELDKGDTEVMQLTYKKTDHPQYVPPPPPPPYSTPSSAMP